MPTYIGSDENAHDAPTCLGVLLTNLGTPEAPTPAAVRRYLAEFLSDPRVLSFPAPLRWLLLYLVILPFRSGKSAEAYRKVWTPEGSPLLIHSRALSNAGRTSVVLGLSDQVPRSQRT